MAVPDTGLFRYGNNYGHRVLQFRPIVVQMLCKHMSLAFFKLPCFYLEFGSHGLGQVRSFRLPDADHQARLQEDGRQ